MDRLPEDVHSKFRFVLLAANRAEQLMRGAPPRVDPKDRKLTSVAVDEISQGAVDWSLTDGKPASAEAAEVVEVAEEAAEPAADEADA